MAKYPWKTAWVTGASGGIGVPFVTQLAAHGVAVAATARDRANLDALAKAHAGVGVYPADVLAPDSLKAAVESIEKELGPIDLAVVGAGMYAPFDFRAIDLDGFHRSMRLNVDGAINTIAAVLPSMLERRGGHIAIMGSLFGYSGWPENGSYGASKAAVINLAESLKLELEGTGVDLTLISPGFVDTPLNAAYAREKKHYLMTPSKAVRRILARLGDKPYEIAFPGRVAFFLKLVRSLPRRISFPLIGWYTRRR